MLTKYILTLNGTEYDVPDECLANWNDISFTCARTDYSGVMRSYSTEFSFVGEIRDLLWAAYLADGFLATASIAVYTITNLHEWEKQYEADLDFSTIEDEDGKLKINALDDSLAALIKAKKSQKYQFSMDDLDSENVDVRRIVISNLAYYDFLYSTLPTGVVDLRMDESKSSIISTSYIEPVDESTGADDTAANRFFANVHAAGATLNVNIVGVVRCWLSPIHYGLAYNVSVPEAKMNLGYWDNDTSEFVFWATMVNDNIRYKLINGTSCDMWIGGTSHANYTSVSALQNAASSHTYGLHYGMFGIVGTNTYSSSAYWTGNHVYEYNGSTWVDKGLASEYYQDRLMVGSSSMASPGIATDHYPMLNMTSEMTFFSGYMRLRWTDPVEENVTVRTISPLSLIQKVLDEISPGTTVSIADDDAGLLATTRLVPSEELRLISDAKVYTTFQQFADWMSAVFGYTYSIDGTNLQFVHRSAVFDSSVVTEMESVKGIKYKVNDALIYTEVDAGYSKKDYGEIDGRLETNFTNYYSTGYTVTDNKLSLISKYRSDAYGIEFTARKNDSETTDDKADEDIFFLQVSTDDNGDFYYYASNNAAYLPSLCVENNKGFIAAMGNGAAITLEMTSSDGNNELEDVTIAAGTALFTAGELEFTTDEMSLPSNLHGLLSVSDGTYVYTGYIKEAKARFGKENGVEYKLIVKEITAL